MPIYEYFCRQCQRKSTLYRASTSQAMLRCPKCGSDSLERRFSTFSVRTTYKDVYDNILSDSQLTRGMMGNDPKALAEWNKRMSQGEPPAPEYEEMIERMEAGEMPAGPAGTDSIESAQETD